MDPRIYEIVSNKPELINNFPDWMLSEKQEHELKNTEGLAIAEIAGRIVSQQLLRQSTQETLRHSSQPLLTRALSSETGRSPSTRRSY